MDSTAARTYLGIDPGPETSGFVVWRRGRALYANSAEPNADVLAGIGGITTVAALFSLGALEPPDTVAPTIAIETPEVLYLTKDTRGRPRPPGKETVTMILWTGRFIQAAETARIPAVQLSPQQIRKAVCGTTRSNDSAVRTNLIRLLGAPGTKTKPGRTYGVSGHAWRALAAIFAAHPEIAEQQPQTP